MIIEHYPERKFQLAAFTSPFTVDINLEVKNRLKGQELTNAIALKILKQIKFKSDVLSFLTKSIVLISLGTLILIGGYLIPAKNTALLVLRSLICGIGGGVLGYSVENHFNKFLSKISQAYSEQSTRAAEYIKQLESSNEQVTLAYP